MISSEGKRRLTPYAVNVRGNVSHVKAIHVVRSMQSTVCPPHSQRETPLLNQLRQPTRHGGFHQDRLFAQTAAIIWGILLFLGITRESELHTARLVARRLIGKDGSLMNDLISRQAAIDVVKGIDRHFVKYIEELPSAQPERKKGHWIYRGPDRILKWICPFCHRVDCYFFNFCPDCGADLRMEDQDD